MRFVQLIEEVYPDGTWTEQLSAGRLQKARHFQSMHEKRGKHIPLLDCLQFSDKGQLLVRHPDGRDRLRIDSVRTGMRGVRRVEGLRNNLAHAQDIVENDWLTIVDLLRYVREVEIPGPLRAGAGSNRT